MSCTDTNMTSYDRIKIVLLEKKIIWEILRYFGKILRINVQVLRSCMHKLRQNS